jgi:Uma2 family endonuclease
MPDVAFFSWDRLPEGRAPTVPIPAIYPDLAIEVLSAGNTNREMARKLREYFAAGTRLVWYVDPALRAVTAYTSETTSVVLTAGGSLDGGDVLPGFVLPVNDLFAVLDERRGA